MGGGKKNYETSRNISAAEPVFRQSLIFIVYLVFGHFEKKIGFTTSSRKND